MNKNILLSTSFKDIDLNQECGELCQYFIEQFNEVRGTTLAKKPMSVYLTKFEKTIVDEFCNENDTTFSNLVRSCFWRDGAILDSLAIALSQEKLANLKFLELDLDTFTFKYLDKYAVWNEKDYANAFKESGRTYPISDRSLVVEAIEKHRKMKEYDSYGMYAKLLLIANNIFPADASKHIVDNLRSMTNAKGNKKERLSKKTNSIKLNISMLETEQNLFDAFNAKLKENNLTFSILCKYRLIEEKIMDPKFFYLSKKHIEACEDFKYERPEADGDFAYYKEAKIEEFGSKRYTNNISMTTEARDTLYANEETEKGLFPQWMRINVLNHYRAYPVVGSESIVSLFLKKKAS